MLADTSERWVSSKTSSKEEKIAPSILSVTDSLSFFWQPVEIESTPSTHFSPSFSSGFSSRLLQSM